MPTPKVYYKTNAELRKTRRLAFEFIMSHEVAISGVVENEEGKALWDMVGDYSYTEKDEE